MQIGTKLITKVPVAQGNITASEAINLLQNPDYECIEYFYIVNEDLKFLAIIPTRLLFQSHPDTFLSTLISNHLHTAKPSDSFESAAGLAVQYKIEAVPVCDENDRFLGIVPPHIIIKTLRNEHLDDMHKMVGIHKEMQQVKQSLNEPPLIRAKERLPWLLIGLIGSMLATFLMSRFEEILAAQVALSFFVPGIVYLADAIGTQTETIAVRGISMTKMKFGKMLVNELGTGLIIGVVLALIYVPFVGLLFQNWLLAFTVATAILLAGGIATTIGVLFPWLLKYFKTDPAFGSGPLATIIQDILSILIYFWVANWIFL
jgi:magnesium transporter